MTHQPEESHHTIAPQLILFRNYQIYYFMDNLVSKWLQNSVIRRFELGKVLSEFFVFGNDQEHFKAVSFKNK